VGDDAVLPSRRWNDLVANEGDASLDVPELDPHDPCVHPHGRLSGE
jgi:hypothetical protein